MPGAKGSSQSAGSAKKQQSISSFFTKPTSTTTLPTTLTAQTSNTSSCTELNGAAYANGESSHDSDEEMTSTTRSLSRTSKRSLKYIQDDTNDDIDDGSLELPNRKRPRVSDISDNDSTSVASKQEPPKHSSNNGGNLTNTAANSVKSPKLSERTSKYLFSSSPARDEEHADVDEETRLRREKLHHKFVKKLGRPDSIAEIKRRKWQTTEETADDQLPAEVGEEDADAEEALPKSAARGKKGAAAKEGSSKLTPMEKQVLEIKNKHMDTLLVVEVGYKFRFFGEDARIAAKELSIVCIPGKFRYDEDPSEAHLDRFASASIPVHRLHVHVKRLVAAGHKVGVVRQLETAALKAAGDNRNAPFVRKLTNLYTKGTYIDDVAGLEGPVDGPSGGDPATGYLLCITENNAKGWGTDEKVHVGVVAVQPATGDVIYDDFEDAFMRSEIETRLLHIAPCEFLIVGELSKATQKLVQHLSGSKSNVFGDKIRVERIDRPKTMAAQSYSHVSNFYAGKMKATGSTEDERSSNLLDKVMKLPENVTICLSAMITHMTEYGLEHIFDLTKYFQSFSARSHMLLNGTTLTSLELYQNQTDHSGKGSLFWALDRTQTRFGQRLLRKWVGRPLLDKTKLEERIAAVEELKDGDRSITVDKLKSLLSKIKSDLEKSLIRIYYGKVHYPYPNEVPTVTNKNTVHSPRALDCASDHAAHWK